MFPPVHKQQRLLVVGDLAEKLPVTAAKALGIGLVVAVDISNRIVPNEPKSALDAALQAGQAPPRPLSIALAQPELVITLAADPPSKPSTTPGPV